MTGSSSRRRAGSTPRRSRTAPRRSGTIGCRSASTQASSKPATPSPATSSQQGGRQAMTDLFDFYPYAERYGVNREIPMTGRPREEILGELREMATAEDRAWEDGKCSGTMYCGDRDHYAFLKEAFGLFAHQNALQRDMCPSATRFEGEIIAMALDLMHAGSLNGAEPAGMVTSGGSASIGQAVLAYREQGREARGIDRPNLVKPETGHPAFDKACHLYGVEMR